VLSVVRPADVTDAARVGPRVLVGNALLARGEVDAALESLDIAAGCEDEPAVLLSRRLAVASYAAALQAAGRLDEAVIEARRAVDLTAEDVRSRVAAARVLAGVLAEAGETEEAATVAAAAVRSAYATQQTSERAGADAMQARLAAHPLATGHG
jgi:tetratricopeptide (TPR) repeat protein